MKEIMDLLSANEVVFIGNDGTREEGKIVVEEYDGARTDRLRDRNEVTKILGLPELDLPDFYCLANLESGWGTFLADLLVDCAKGKGKIYADGEEVFVPKDWKFEGSYLGYSPDQNYG